ncbi:hypothetical protein YWIDRAFT_06706 [Streptomyces sp. SceaMP-e96]|uniref:hypothetical protein n=1 Tax=unclassified Streptomyces TaxID=2593676 RepID=UPI000823E3FE|nr:MULTISPECIES: hypothetical protein [unclassified Streptomyces]MYT17108.1 hypothetical protein [Streptomyces sp. SID4951]SCK39809.1 hypothetical protein YWIDRAFT_06706 [Streptomyces sp. SceaMP-e96]
MNEPARLETEDEADFECTLRRALNTPDIRAALQQPTTPVTAERLRARALAAADTIAAEAAAEYAVLVQLRATARTPAPTTGSDGGRGLLAALAVLTPLLSAPAAAIFLLLGHAFRLAGAQQPVADTLIGAGWIAAAVAALAVLAAAAALLTTAARHRATPHTPQTPALAQAHQAWQRALLERGLLPFLYCQLQLPASQALPPSPSSQRRARLGYSSPDYASPDFTGPTSPSGD